MQQRPIKRVLQNQIGVPEQTKKQEDDVQCCQTKIWLWDQDQYDESDSDYLNQIFPYKINKTTMTPGSKFIFHFLASSLHFWVELVQQKQKQQGKLGLKDAKFLKQVFQQDQSDNWIAFRRWGQHFMQKQRFHTQQQKQNDFQPPKGGQTIHTYKRDQSQFVIIKYLGDNKDFTEYKKRMEVLFLFYIDGVSFVKEEVDTWVYYLIFKKKQNKYLFVGAMSLYVFKISTNKQRHRISQVFILPTYQKHGHGKQILDTVYQISLQETTCFQITTQIPSFQYQCLRDFKQASMMLESKIMDVSSIPISKNADEINKVKDNLLSKEVLREIKTKLKLPGHQIQRIAHIFIYQKIANANDDMAKAHFEQYLRKKIIYNRSPFKSRQKLPHITFFGQSPQMKQFYLQKAKQDFLRNQTEIQQLLTQTIDGYNRVINKLHKTKVL